MDSDDPRDMPAFLLGGQVRRTRQAVATPARRWRVIVEQSKPLGHDLLLETVVKLQHAGERSAVAISDLLQLPIELVQHLQSRAVTESLRISATGEFHSTSTEVVWIYRDLVTDELYPESSPELPPVHLRFSVRGDEAWFEQGSAGRPVRVDCLVLAASPHAAAVPSALELARFSQATRDVSRRTAVVSEGEACLVISPLHASTSGPVVATTTGIRHGGLTRCVDRLAQEQQRVARWLQRLPKPDKVDAATDTNRPLRAASSAVRSAHQEWASEPSPAAALALLSQIELAVRRYCDQCWYAAGLDPSRDNPAHASDGFLRVRLSLSTTETEALLQGGPGSVATVVRRLVSAPRSVEIPGLDQLSQLAKIAAAVLLLQAAPPSTGALDQLARDVESLCEQLLKDTEALSDD